MVMNILKRSKLTCCILLLVILTGCSYNQVNNNQHIEERKEESGLNTAQEVSSEPNQSEDIEVDMDNKLFENIIHKIWIVKSDDNMINNDFSFFIRSIDGENVVGKLATRSVAKPEFYFYSTDSSKYLGELNGTVSGEIIRGEFNDSVGNSGSVIITYINDEELEVEINYSTKRDLYENIDLNGVFTLQPYTLADVEELNLIEEKSVDVNLNKWGDVKIVAGEVITGDIFHPASFIVNSNSEILYFFDAAFQVGTRISKISVEDTNMDGLKDVTVITDFIEDSEIESIVRVFLQNESGEFVSSSLLEK